MNVPAKRTFCLNLGLSETSYALMTLHRPSNVDIKAHFVAILNAVEQVQGRIPIVFPVHPRTQSRIEEFGFLGNRVASMRNLKLVGPVGYSSILNLMMNAKFVLTDSGGMQEETTVLNISCLTLRDNTERPETVGIDTNTLVGCDARNDCRGKSEDSQRKW